MAMDFSSPYTGTPPLHGPQNTGYTYALSSSYSSKALSYEKENKTGPVFETPRMSRRSLRLHTVDGRYGDNSLADLSLNHSVTYSTSILRKQKKDQQQPSHSNIQLLLSTPLKSQGPGSLQSCTASDISMLSSLLDESSTLVDSLWERTMTVDCSEVADSSMVSSSGKIHSAQTQTTMVHNHVCGTSNGHGGKQNASSTHSLSSSSPLSLKSHSFQPSSMVYCRKNKPGAISSISNTCLCYSKKVAASVISIVTFLAWTVLPKIYKGGKGIGGLTSMSTVILRVGEAAVTSSVSLMRQLTQDLLSERDVWGQVAGNGGHLGHSRSARVACLTADGKMNGSLWKAAAGVFWWARTMWYQLTSFISVLDVFILTRCLPKLYRLLLFLLPLLVFLGVWHWGPSSLLGFLPTNLPEWHLFANCVEQDGVEKRSHWATVATAQNTLTGSTGAERLAWLEQRVEQLWEEVQLGGRRQEQFHSKVSAQQQALRQQLEEHTDRAALAHWVSMLMEQRLECLRVELLQVSLQGTQSSVARLAELEGLLRTLEAKTEVLMLHPGSTISPREYWDFKLTHGEVHRTLLAEVQRLEADLDHVRKDLQGVMGCQDKCEQLDTLQDTVRQELRQELRMLFYGPEGAEDAELPETLLPWLSARFVSVSDLQGALVDLEHEILRNVSLQLDLSGQPPSPQAVADTVGHNAGAAGMSEEQVQLIVKNALKLYSQDRTGLADYALESGGGSILSTRCSETFETKTALMSLFGLPLWYFSQSPRVVIQPDVHPGNCWAFKGSQGYLVIRLSTSVLPTAFSLEHVPKTLTPAGNISSAPQHFSVYGLEDEHQVEGKLLGNYTYKEDSDSLQTYPVTEENNHAFQIIELRVLSNWGHPDYTCLYRFRVHGEPQPR
ncbi:SUN domain-containing protein 1-like [Arapaima gigas]